MNGGAQELSHEELEAAKRYMRIDCGEEDLLVAGCLMAAREYLAGAGVSLPKPGTSRRALYDLVAHSLALSAYDQRDPLITGMIVNDNPFLRQCLTQLKLTEGGAG